MTAIRREDFDLPYPEGDDPKEVYAFFGLAAYWSQVLEREAIHFAFAVRLATADKVSREIVEKVLSELETKTLGSVLRVAGKLTEIPPELDMLLEEALRKRNHLIHHFFFTNAEEFLSPTGRLRMVASLQEHMVVYKAANDQLEPLTLGILARFGVTAEAVQREWEALLERAPTHDHI